MVGQHKNKKYPIRRKRSSCLPKGRSAGVEANIKEEEENRNSVPIEKKDLKTSGDNGPPRGCAKKRRVVVEEKKVNSQSTPLATQRRG